MCLLSFLLIVGQTEFCYNVCPEEQYLTVRRSIHYNAKRYKLEIGPKKRKADGQGGEWGAVSIRINLSLISPDEGKQLSFS